MILARVKGHVVATEKHPCYIGHRVLVVQPIDGKGKDKGKSFLSYDTVSAGPGDVVLVQQEGNTARQLLGKMSDPFHSVIVGIVDEVLYGTTRKPD